MLLMSMLSLPMMTAEVFMKRFKGMMLLSIAVSLVCSLAGLFIGTLVDVPSSAIIVMIMAAVFIIARLSRSLFRHKNLKKY